MVATFQDRITQLFDKAKDNDYKLTKDQFAARYGGSRSQLNGWLAGKGEPGSEMLKRIATTFDVTVDWLVGIQANKNDGSDTVTGRPNPATLALHRTDNPEDDLPEEALKQLEDYIGLLRLKYKKKPD